MLCIFSKVKAYLVQIGYGFDQNCLKELKHFRLVLMGEEVMKLMQPSMANLNSPLSRVVKDSTPSRRWILRCINFRIGESSHNIFFGCGESLPNKIQRILNKPAFYSFIIFSFESESFPKISKSASWFFTQLYFHGGESWLNCFRKKVNWWWILTYRFCWKGEQRWRLEVGRFKMPFDACIRPRVYQNQYFLCSDL